MMHAVVNVIRGEGLISALRRTRERAGESAHAAALRAAGWLATRPEVAIVNVAAGGIAPRTGGVAIQLMARLRAERALRPVAVVHGETLRFLTPHAHARRIAAGDWATAMAMAGARALHVEGTAGISLAELVRLCDSGTRLVVSIHDFSLWSASPHLLEPWDAPERVQREHRHLATRLLGCAAGVIFPSDYLLERHRELFGVPLTNAAVVEPASDCGVVPQPGKQTAVACAGSVKRHKGGHLLPEIARMLAARGTELHLFGGGDAELLVPLRHMPNVIVHGYYRAGTLPMLLARHGVGLVLLPSIVPETYSLALSESWLAGARAVAFDLGALAERIRRDGGGWLVPLASGAKGLVEIVERWQSGVIAAEVPRVMASAESAARETVRLYREWGLLP